MHKRRIEHHEYVHGPHFSEKSAKKVVSGMENEDGTEGAHYTLEEAIIVAEKYGISLKKDHYNKYDWYVALNMVYSDYCHVVHAISGVDTHKCFAKLAEAWLCDKDIDEGKMWYYYKYIMCDCFREEDEEDEWEEEEALEPYHHHKRESKRISRY